MTDLTQDELTCLAISAQGENMLAIGRWEKPIDRLVELGLLTRFDKFNHQITSKGKLEAERLLADTDDAYAKAAIDVHNAQTQYKLSMDQAAQQLVNAAKCKQLLTGQFPNQCAYGLAQEILQLALAKL